MNLNKLLVNLAALTIVFAPAMHVGAETTGEPVLNPEQQDALAGLVVALAEPPPVSLKAKLRPPLTFYYLGYTDSDAYRTLLGSIIQNGKLNEKHIALRGSYLQGIVWNADLSCGSWSAEGRDIIETVWHHPDGLPPQGCPHGQGTDHPGTIRVSGTFMVTAEYDDRSSPHNGATLFEKRWRFECAYQTSKAGEAPCEITLDAMTGIADSRQAQLMQPDNTQSAENTEVPKLSRDRRLTIAGFIAAPLFGIAAYYLYRKRKG